jgi:hypothetical protein
VPQVEGVCSDVIKYRLFLVLDGVLEGTDRLSSRNFDGKYVAWIIAMNETVEFEDGMIE